MRRTEVLQEIRLMRFGETYGYWKKKEKLENMNWHQHIYRLAVMNNPNFDYDFNKTVIEEVYNRYRPHIMDEKDPNSKIARSWAQFVCHTRLKSRKRLALLEAASFLFLPFYILLVLWRGLHGKRRSQCENTDGVAIGSYLMKELKDEDELGKLVRMTPSEVKRYATINDMKFIIRCLRHVYTRLGKRYIFQFGLKVIKSISLISPLIDYYKPKFICSEEQLDFTSSVQTYYMNLKGVQHYNFMHGDKYFFCRDAFFYFNRMFVWDHFYADLFKRMYAKADLFVIQRPAIFKRKLERRLNNRVCVLFPDFDLAEKQKIFISMLRALANSEIKLMVRPHPICDFYFRKLKDLLPGNISVSDPSCQSVAEMLDAVDGVIGFPSTVLMECAFNHKCAVFLRNNVVDQIIGYHFIFRKPNVFVADINGLRPETLRKLLNRF